MRKILLLIIILFSTSSYSRDYFTCEGNHEFNCNRMDEQICSVNNKEELNSKLIINEDALTVYHEYNIGEERKIVNYNIHTAYPSNGEIIYLLSNQHVDDFISTRHSLLSLNKIEGDFYGNYTLHTHQLVIDYIEYGKCDLVNKTN